MKRFSAEKLRGWHQAALDAYTEAVEDEAQQEQRSKIIETNRFVRIPGAQWEGQTFSGTDLKDRLDKYPRFEINKIAREVKRISSEFRKNRINVEFKPADGRASQEISDKLNRRYRADYQESNGDYAVTAAFEDAITGGMGAFKLCAEYEDENDIENEDMIIRIKPIFDPASCLFFDRNSKEMDKSDAEWMAEAFSMTAKAFEDEFGRQCQSITTIDTGRQQDYQPTSAVYLCRMYQKKQEKDEIVSFVNPTTGQMAKYYASEIADIEAELAEKGFIETGKRRKTKRDRVYCGLMDAAGWLDEPELLPFDLIPIVVVYGERWYVDGEERVQGHATVALDAQRLENLMVSMLADTATLGNEGTPVIDVEQVAGLEKFWADRNKKRPAYLPLKSIKDKNGNIVAPAAVSSYTQPANINPALANLLQYTGQSIQQLTGSASLDNMPSNLAQQTVNDIFSRSDSHSGVYMDNLSFAMKYCGRVWYGACKLLYGNDRTVKLVSEDGVESFDTMSAFITDKETGRKVYTNDLTVGRYVVAVDVGQDFTTRRDATVAKLTPILQVMPPDNPNYQAMLSMVIDNLDGEGLDDLRKYNRKQLLLSGVAEPKNQDEQAILDEAAAAAQESQPQDGNVLLAQAEMEKARVQKMKVMLDAGQSLREYELKRAELELRAAELGVNLQLKAAQIDSMRVDDQVKVGKALAGR